MTLLDIYAGWGDYQAMVVRAIAPLEDEQLGLAAGPGLWPIRMLASHMVSARKWWFHDWMGDGGSEWDEYEGWDDLEEMGTRKAPVLVRALEESWSLMSPSLARWTAADLEAKFTRPTPNAAGERPLRARGWIVWHVAEHDVYHGGEISLTLGMHGVPGLGL
jgi:uncharacterized damage-inducible protein DinB